MIENIPKRESEITREDLCCREGTIGKDAWNRVLRGMIRPSNRSGCHEKCFRTNLHNSEEHERVKFEIYLKLIHSGWDVWTEAILITGDIADILVIKDGEGKIIEIMHTETEKRLAEKKEKYPIDFDFISVQTKDFDIEKFNID